MSNLKDGELEKVSGGNVEVGNGFSFADAWPGHYNGEWFYKTSEPDLAYNVFSSEYGKLSYIANRYWYKDGEAWPFGTCTLGSGDVLYVIETPTIIHAEFTGTKPF